MSGAFPTRLAASVALFERSANYALEGLSGITGSDLGRPTPCARWDLRALLLHLADSADALTELIATGRLCLTTPPRPIADAPAAARDRTHRLLHALRSADHFDTLWRVADQALWASTAARAGAIEFAAHGWDIATARGVEREIPAGLATDLLELSPMLITDWTRHPEFGPAVPVPPGASPSDRLVGFLGRRPPSRV
jgi:uncharacterized protein (TIGR03086 family)